MAANYFKAFLNLTFALHVEVFYRIVVVILL